MLLLGFKGFKSVFSFVLFVLWGIYPNYKTDIKEMLKFSPFAKASKEEILREAMGDENFQLYNNIYRMRNLKGIQARIPFTFQIK